MTAASQIPPTRPETFGEELRRLRESAGFTLEQIMAETKISRRILEALEGGRFQFLPERVFSRNFVRQYAQFIGYNENRLLEWFDEAWKRFELASGSFHPPEAELEPPKTPIRWRFWIPICIAGLIVAIVVAVIARSSPNTPDLAPDPRRVRSAALQPPPSPIAARTPTANNAPAEASPERVQETIEFGIVVEQATECWLHYRDRDGHTGEHLIPGGMSLTLELVGPAVVTLGNAGAVARLQVAGTTYDQLGTSGQVLHLEVSTAGIRRLKGMAPPPNKTGQASAGRGSD